MDLKKHIHESNLIEGFDSHEADHLLSMAWLFLKGFPIEEKIIIYTWKIITLHQKELKAESGYRTINVHVGGRLCRAPWLVPELMHNWILDMNENWQNLDPKEMHIRFEKIHPFVDGNGRTGRLLMWWHEMKLGREPTLILNSEKEEYYKWFK